MRAWIASFCFVLAFTCVASEVVYTQQREVSDARITAIEGQLQTVNSDLQVMSTNFDNLNYAVAANGGQGYKSFLFKSCRHNNIDNAGKDTLAECLQFCNERDDCFAVAYLFENKRCYRKTVCDVSSLINDHTVYTYIKTSVGFLAVMDRDILETKDDSPLPFGVVELNQGSGYSASTYQFTCPLRGLYYFSFSVYSSWLHKGMITTAYIRHSRLGNIAQVYLRNDNSWGIYGQAPTSCVTLCNAGDIIDVRPHDRNSNSKFYGNGQQGDKRTTFTGFLIQAL